MIERYGKRNGQGVKEKDDHGKIEQQREKNRRY
jgi:hypothetical protein